MDIGRALSLLFEKKIQEEARATVAIASDIDPENWLIWNHNEKKDPRTDWETPYALFKVLNDRFKFNLDVCADEVNHKVPVWISEETDGLKYNWGGATCWMNPPYDRSLGNWVRKAMEESFYHGATVVALLPARTDSPWWAEFVIPFASEVIFLTGRVKFNGAKNSATFASVVVVWVPFSPQHPYPETFPKVSAMKVPKG